MAQQYYRIKDDPKLKKIFLIADDNFFQLMYDNKAGHEISMITILDGRCKTEGEIVHFISFDKTLEISYKKTDSSLIPISTLPFLTGKILSVNKIIPGGMLTLDTVISAPAAKKIFEIERKRQPVNNLENTYFIYRVTQNSNSFRAFFNSLEGRDIAGYKLEFKDDIYKFNLNDLLILSGRYKISNGVLTLSTGFGDDWKFNIGPEILLPKKFLMRDEVLFVHPSWMK